jgi:hypothetical protein
MAKLSKAEAARRIGVTRATLYRYISEGRVPVEPDGSIETTELLKRGYTLNASEEIPRRPTRHFETVPAERLIETLERDRDRLIRELEEAKAREAVAVQEKAQLLEMIRTLSLPPAHAEWHPAQDVHQVANNPGVLSRFRTWFWGRPR